MPGRLYKPMTPDSSFQISVMIPAKLELSIDRDSACYVVPGQSDVERAPVTRLMR